MPTLDKTYNRELVAFARRTKSRPMPKATKPLPNDRQTSRKPRKRKDGRRLIFKPEILARTGMSYPNIWDKMQRGEFPRSVQVFGKCGWYSDEFEDWLENLPRKPLKGDPVA